MMPFNAEKFLVDYSDIIPSRKDGPNSHLGWVQICCPFCIGGDDNYHGGFNIDDGHYNCWKCGGYSITSVIAKSLKCSYKEAKEIIRTYKGPPSTQKDSLKNDFKRPNVFDFPKYFRPIEGIYRQYLENRNFDPRYLEKKYNIKSSGPVGFYKFRIIAPIYYRGRIVSFQGRDITGAQRAARYKACKAENEVIHHKDILYNLDNCNKDTIAVVEGFFDVMRVGDDCAGTFGTEWTVEQFMILKERFKRIFIIYDNEREAQNKAIKLAMGLNSFSKDVEIFKLDRGDPADLSPDDALHLRRELNI